MLSILSTSLTTTLLLSIKASRELVALKLFLIFDQNVFGEVVEENCLLSEFINYRDLIEINSNLLSLCISLIFLCNNTSPALLC